MDDPRLAGYSEQYIKEITQHFKAASINTTELVGKKGLKLTVNPTMLQKEDGSGIDGVIQVDLIELTTSEDLFRANATTVSDGKLLASGGSYYIGMACNGQKIRIRNGCSLKVNFPQLASGEMQLFYGQRDSSGNINWESSGKVLKSQQESISFTDNYNPDYKSIPHSKETRLYDSLTSLVYYYSKQMTIKDFVDTLQKRGIDISIDTVYLHDMFTSQNFGENYLSGKRYRIMTAKERKEEADRLEKEKALNEQQKRDWENNSLAGQVKKYYAPSTIGSLGWINCDRFFQNNENTDVDLDLPITMSGNSVQYFVIFRSFNGLLRGNLNPITGNKFTMEGLPLGQPVTIVAFTKIKGQVFESSRQYMVQKNTPVPLDFKLINPSEITAMFKNNVKI